MHYPPQQPMSDFGLAFSSPRFNGRILPPLQDDFSCAYFCRATSIVWDPFLVPFASQSSSCRLLCFCRHFSSLSTAAHGVDCSRTCAAPARSGYE